jgi:hypothetical protein
MKEGTILRSEAIGQTPRAPPWGEQERKESEDSELLLDARERRRTFNEMLQHAFDEMLHHEGGRSQGLRRQGATNGIDTEATVSPSSARGR